MIQAANPLCEVHVLACASHLKTEGCASSDAFEEAWNKISDQSAPEAYIYGVEKLDGKELIHDRWLLTKGSGLRFGTSMNSIGAKLSEISVMTPDELSRCEGELDKFLNKQLVIDGVRVKVTRYQI
jgi:predicted metal-dependent hydrolase